MTKLTITKHLELIKSGKISVSENYHTQLEKAKNLNLESNAIVRFFAERSDEELNIKAELPLAGLPIIIKDNILLEGEIASCGSKMLEDFKAPYTASCLKNLLQAGAIPLGSANMDEFAMGGANETSYFGAVKNPFGENRIPGGSSGGSAVAVASGMVAAALGTDTGGSVRQPASMCGIVGYKPTYGTISRYGVVAMASSLDQVGIFANTVEDVQTLFSFLASYDEKDATSSPKAEEIKKIEKTDFHQGKFFVPEEALDKGLDPKIKQRFIEKIEELRKLGHTVDIKPLPILKSCLAIYYTLMPSEVSTNLSRFDGIRYGQQADTHDFESLDVYYAQMRANGFGDEVKRRILLGTYILSSANYESYYLKAQKAQSQLKSEFSKLFESYDAVLTPTSPEVAWKIGAKNGDPLKSYLSDLYTVPANLAELPAISVPMGYIEEDGEELPIGIQLMTNKWEDQKLFALAKIVENL